MPTDRPVPWLPSAVPIPQGRLLYELALFARDNEALPLDRTFSAAIERMAAWLKADFLCLHFVSPEELDEAVDVECLRYCAGRLSTDVQAIERTLSHCALEASGPIDTRQHVGPFHRAIGVPLRYGGELYAVINAYFMREDTSPTREALDAVAFLGHYLFAGVKRRVALRDGRDYGTVIALLATLLNARGDGLGSFTHRTMHLIESLAVAAGVGSDELRVVRRAALVHDIGMIIVPEAILLKAGPLTDDERMTLQRHAAVGEQFLSHLTGRHMHAVALAVGAHHEWYDGSGYPRGLQGDAIPRSARLIAICDAYEAMTSFRPYRPALPREAALAELAAGAGHQFDCTLVEIFQRARCWELDEQLEQNHEDDT